MSYFRSFLSLAALISLLTTPKLALAEPSPTEERFQELFVTAGYATAFGAALGAASLSFYPQPDQNLRMIAVGASLGFIGGSLLGTYMALTPVMVEHSKAFGETEIASTSTFRVMPAFSNQSLGMLAEFQLDF